MTWRRHASRGPQHRPYPRSPPRRLGRARTCSLSRKRRRPRAASAPPPQRGPASWTTSSAAWRTPSPGRHPHPTSTSPPSAAPAAPPCSRLPFLGTQTPAAAVGGPRIVHAVQARGGGAAGPGPSRAVQPQMRRRTRLTWRLEGWVGVWLRAAGRRARELAPEAGRGGGHQGRGRGTGQGGGRQGAGRAGQLPTALGRAAEAGVRGRAVSMHNAGTEHASGCGGAVAGPCGIRWPSSTRPSTMAMSPARSTSPSRPVTSAACATRRG